MEDTKHLPALYEKLMAQGCISIGDIAKSEDGFCAVCRSLADILASRGIMDFPDSTGQSLLCSRFFDDWYLYALPAGEDCVYSLFKLREQEQDEQDGLPADGDTPGVTVSFISFTPEPLLTCLEDPVQEHRRKLSDEINRVVAYRGQRHHEVLKAYFRNSMAQGAYLMAMLYIEHVASFARDGFLEVPKRYGELYQQSLARKSSGRKQRLPAFLEAVNQKAGHTVCNHQRIYIRDKTALSEYEAAAILATHTGNVSLHSFAAEVEFHAWFLTPLARLRLPILGRSIYDSAIRADMTIDDKEWEGPAPFYRLDSRLVKRHRRLHPKATPAHKQTHHRLSEASQEKTAQKERRSL